MKKKNFYQKKFIVRKVLIISSIAIVVLILFLYKPISTSSLTSNPQPAQSYQEAIFMLNNLEVKDDNPEINPVCKSILLTHGKKTEKVLIVFHGYTNCPKQFEQFAQLFYNKGYNVFIPRIPHHGLKDRLTNDLSNLTANELAQFTDEAIDIGQGLGEQVYITGISAGGVMAAWAGQYRDVKKTVPIAPIFAYSYPKSMALPMSNLVRVLPEHYRWWDEATKDQIKGPQYA